MTIRLARRLDGVERTLIRRIVDSAPADAIHLGLGQPDLPPPDFVAEAGVAAIRSGRTGYTTTAGLPALRAAIAAAAPPGFAPDADHVAITVGSQEAMFAAAAALLDPGDELLIPDPGYPAYATVAKLLGARAIPYPLRAERGFRVAVEDVAALLGERTRAVILCEPSNPTGAYGDRAELERLVALLGERGVPWISDEIYAALDYEGRFVSPAALAPGGGLVLGSLSKDLAMTGWRLGWVVGPAETIDRIVAVHQHLVTCAPTISQRAAEICFGEEAARARETALATFRRRREVLLEALDGVPGLVAIPPRGAFYVFADVREHGDDVALARRLIEQANVVTIPGTAFGERGRGFLRISFAASEASLLEGARRIRAALSR